MSKRTILRWDLDKTYLVSDFESLRGLLRIPFERAEDKRSIPGVVELVKTLRRAAHARGRTTTVSFVTASPPQIGKAIREKLALDGIECEEIRFKDQIRHLVRGRFDVLREHVGFKLAELLESARSGDEDADEILFGDDWESDPLTYSLYADAIEGRLSWPRLEVLLVRAGVHLDYREATRAALVRRGPRRTVRAICILRARPRLPAELEEFGARLFWFDNYLECALILHALGELDGRGVAEVAAVSGLAPDAITAGFESVSSRWPRLRREHLAGARHTLVQAGLMRPVLAGSLLVRAGVHWRRLRGKPPLDAPILRARLDYDALVGGWTHRAQTEAKRT